jgi:hypothetical protein
MKIRKGGEILSSVGSGDRLIINFRNKYTYKSFKQKRNHLIIDTTEGEVDIVFSGETPNLEFSHFEKDQLVLIIS